MVKPWLGKRAQAVQIKKGMPESIEDLMAGIFFLHVRGLRLCPSASCGCDRPQVRTVVCLVNV